jgi:hypothetical protein
VGGDTAGRGPSGDALLTKISSCACRMDKNRDMYKNSMAAFLCWKKTKEFYPIALSL